MKHEPKILRNETFKKHFYERKVPILIQMSQRYVAGDAERHVVPLNRMEKRICHEEANTSMLAIEMFSR